jgi:DNA-binding CsgD family transcriptional regulator
MQDFAVATNIERYADRFSTEADAAVRATIKILLVEEEKRLGFHLKQLDRVDRYIADCHRHIERQKLLSKDQSRDGARLRASQPLLVNLKELLSLFEHYRQLITKSLREDTSGRVRAYREAARGANSLTAREAEVLALLAQGNTSDQAASVLGITRRTVDAHAEAILLKLEAANRPQAVAIAIGAGIIKFN